MLFAATSASHTQRLWVRTLSAKDQFILGVNAYHGDVSAVLLKNGELVAALEEERFRRVKHWAGFPTASIRRVLDTAGINASEVGHVAVSRDPRANLLKKALFALSRRPNKALIRD